MTQVIRGVLSTILFVSFRNYIKNIPLLILLLILTDFLDTHLENPITHSFTFEYHKYDKIFDAFTYTLVLLLYRHLFDEKTYFLLWIALLYRCIGVYLFYYTKDKKYLYYYPDVIKEFMLIGFLSENLRFFKNYYPLFIVLTVVIKVQFEKLLAIFRDF